MGRSACLLALLVSIPIRAEFRDHLQWCDDACLEGDPVLHQIELSAGLEIGL